MKLRNFVATIVSLAVGHLFIFLVEPGQAAPLEGTIVAAGDSLTAGYGLPERDAYPAQLERKLNQNGYRWKVVNAGISGETSSGLLSRVDWILKLKPDIVILETGANDGLRGVDPKVTGANIDKAVTRLQAKGVTVVLAGMRMVTNMGATFTKEFAANYTTRCKEAPPHSHSLLPGRGGRGPRTEPARRHPPRCQRLPDHHRQGLSLCDKGDRP